MNKIKSTERGKAGEALATSYLIERGFTILFKNYRYRKAEIDIIVTDEKELIIVEVRLRQNNIHGFPEDSISRQKQKLIQEAGYIYKERNEILLPVRFDVIAISLEEKEIKHYKDAF